MVNSIQKVMLLLSICCMLFGCYAVNVKKKKTKYFRVWLLIIVYFSLYGAWIWQHVYRKRITGFMQSFMRLQKLCSPLWRSVTVLSMWQTKTISVVFTTICLSDVRMIHLNVLESQCHTGESNWSVQLAALWCYTRLPLFREIT